MNEELQEVIYERLEELQESYPNLSTSQAEFILARMISKWLREPDAYDIEEWLTDIEEQEVEKMSEVKFKVGDKVRRNEAYAKPEIMACYGMSRNTDYVIEYITPKGMLVLENYIMLVQPEYVELSPQPIYGYVVTKYNLDAKNTEILSSLFLSKDEVKRCAEWWISNNVQPVIRSLTIDRTSLLNYIKEHNLLNE